MLWETLKPTPWGSVPRTKWAGTLILYAIQKMREIRPLDIGLQEQVSNRLLAAAVKSRGSERNRKRQNKDFVRWALWRRTQVNHWWGVEKGFRRCQNYGNVSFHRISSEENCLLSERQPAYRWRELRVGFCMELGNQSYWCKGRNSSRKSLQESEYRCRTLGQINP